MSKYKIPTTPENYATWFHYVAGDRPSLKERIDELIATETEFNDELNWELYEQFMSECNLAQAEKIRQEIQQALNDASISLDDGSNEASHYGEVLGKFDESCSSAESISDVYSLLTEVLQETRQMKHSMERMREDFSQKSEELEKLQQELIEVRTQAATDALTGLSNRATFFDIMQQTLEDEENLQHPICVVMADIDHFKRINDTFGHLVGDKVIRFVADTLKKSIKGLDTAARYGGEEFTILLPKTRLDDAVTLCNQIREQIANTNLVRTGTRESLGKITISAGVAEYRQGEEMMDFIQRADEALYYSKEHGRNRVTPAR